MTNTELQVKHTPAPWIVVDNGLWDISIKAGGTVCHINSKGDWFPSGKDTLVGRSQNKMLADARLIAAAPETAAERDKLKAINTGLLEALREAETALSHLQNVMHVRVNPPTLENIQKAIEKAEGQV